MPWNTYCEDRVDKILTTNSSGYTREWFRQRAKQGENRVEEAFGQALEYMLDQWQTESMPLKKILRLGGDDFISEMQKLLDTSEWKLQWIRRELQEGVIS